MKKKYRLKRFNSRQDLFHIENHEGTVIGLVRKKESGFYFEPLRYFIFGTKALASISRILATLNRKQEK